MKKLVRIANLLLTVFLLALATASVAWGEEQPVMVTDAWVDSASLNSLGEVVWSQYDSGTGSQQIFSSMRGQLTTDPNSRYSPAVNNMGDMVWSEYSNGYPSGYVLYGRIKGQVVTLANSNNWLGQADINDRGEVVWVQSDGSGASQIYSNLRGQLTSGSLRNDMPSINNRGEVVFRQSNPSDPGLAQIYMIGAAKGTPVLVASQGLGYSGAAINDNGEIIWVARDFANSTTQIVSSVRGPVLPAPVTDGIFGIDLNSCGDITYAADEAGGRRLYRLGSNAPCVTHPTVNDTQADATPVALGDIFTGMLSWDTNNVIDWYRFEASAGDAIHVLANYDSRAPNSLTIGLYDGQGNLLATSQPGSPLGITYTAGYSGSYYLKAEGGGSRNGYAVSLSKYAENCGAGPCREVLASDVWSGSINSLGEVVWSQYNQELGAQQLFSSTRGQLPAPAGSFNPAINNMGDMVWSEYSNGYPSGYLLKGTIGGIAVTIANNPNYLGQADINDRGEVVWVGADANGMQQVYSNRRGQLTSGAQLRSKPSINNAGDIVFIESDATQPGPGRIFRVAAGSSAPVPVTADQQNYRAVAVNDSGEVVWAVATFDSGTPASQIVSSVRGVVVDRVANDIFMLDVNNCGDVIYSAFDSGVTKLYRFGNSGACGTYQLPNDTPAQAAPVTLGDIFTGVADSTGSALDWYRFDVHAGDTIYVSVNYDNRIPNLLTVSLYDGQGNLVPPVQGNPLQFKVPVASTGTYYLKAEAISGRVGYAVSLSKYSENCGAGPCREVLAQDVWSGSINSLGEVVWGKYNPEIGAHQFYSSTRGQLPTPTSGSNPAINNMGDMVWTEYSYGYPGGYLLRGTISGVPVTITNSQNYLGQPDINDRGEVVWAGVDTSGVQQIYSNRRGQLTSGGQLHTYPSINNAGDIVFIESDPMQPGPGRIFRIAAGSSVPAPVTADQKNYRAVAVNDSGEVVWAVTTFDSATPASQIVSSVRGVVVDRVTTDIFMLDVNTCGDIIYSAYDGGMTNLYRFGNSGACGTYQFPNDTQAQAAPVALGDIFTGVVDSSESALDWYRFQATAGDTIYVSVNYDNRVPNLLTVGLYDGQGNLVAPAQGTPLQLKVTVGGTGTYYLKAEAVAGRVGYAVSLSKYSENCGAGPCREVLADDVWSGSINSLGEVVWSKYNPEIGAQQFFSSTRGQLPAPVGSNSPAINNMGDMVWIEYSYGYPGGYLLRGTIGGLPVTIANSPTYLGQPDINDRGEVVWTAIDLNGIQQVYSNWRGQLTSGGQQHNKPSINNAGEVVFIESDPMQPGPGRIFRIAAGGGVPVPVTADQQNYRAIAHNDAGEVVWAVATFDSAIPGSQIVSSVRGVVVDRVTSDIFTVDVNNCGDIIYTAFDGGVTKLYRFGNSGACGTYQLANDTPAQATPVALGDIFTGVVDSSASALDWYRFEANAGDTIYVTVNYDNRVPNLLTVGLYDGQGNLLAPAQGNPLQLKVPVGSTGTYYLKAEAVAGRLGYAVSLGKYSENCGVGPCRELLADDVWGGSINSLGEVVWGKFNPEIGTQQFYSSTRGQLPAPAGSTNPVINNLGDLVWSEFSYGYPGGYLIKGTINGMPMTIANGENYLSEADINDGGEVVWSTYDANGSRQVYSNVRGQLTTGPLQHSKPSINNAGDIVFIENDPMQPGPGRIYRLAAGSTVPVALPTDPQFFRAVAVNDNGEVVWAVANFDSATPGWDVVSSVRGLLLSNRTGNDIFSLDLNNCGDIVYSAIESGLSKLYRFGNSGACMAVPERSFALAVAKSGNGNGQITSSPAGIALSATDTMALSAFRAGTPVILTATPEAGSRFVGWMGVVGGSEPSTMVMLGQAAQAVAIFELKPVDTEAPTVVITSPMPGISNNNRPDLVYTVSDGNVVVRVDGVTVNLASGMVIGPLADGPHLVRVEATDAAGNVGVAEVSFAVDTVPPALYMNTVTTPTNKGSQLVTGTREAGARIFVATDTAAVIGAVEYPTETTWSFLLSDMQPGYNSLWVSAGDAAGNGASSYTGIDFDNVVPTVVIGAPAPGTTNSRTPILTYSADEGRPVVKVDGVIVTKASGDTLGPLSDGPHTVRVEATDFAGNIGFAEVAFTVDATAPTVTITAPTTGLGNNRSPLLGFSVSDGSCLVAVDGLQLPLNSGDTLGPLADGAHAVRVDCRDEAGNAAFAEVSFSVDATAPAVTINSPAAGLTRNNTPVLAYDAGDGSAVVKVDGVVVSTASGAVLAALADGLHVVRVEAADVAGNTGFAEVSFTVDTTAPVLAMTSPAPGLSNDNRPVLAYTVSDGAVVVKVDGVVVSKGSGDVLDALADGTHTIRVEATDAAGNLASAEVTFSVDTTPPLVAITSPVPGTAPDNTPLLLYSAAEPGAVVKVDGVAVSKPSGSSLDALANGTHTVTVEATDAAGNVGTTSVTFTVSYVPLAITTTSLPFATIGAPYSQNVSASGGVPGYTWSIANGALPDGLSLNTTTGVISGVPSAAGTFSFTVRVDDRDGAGSSASFSVVVYLPLQINPISLPGGFVGASYSRTLAATGGAGNYTWSVVSGSFPAGLSLNASTGQIAGIPTSAGSSSFTVECRDGNQTQATAGFSIVIEAARPDLVVTAVSGPISGTKGKKVMLTATVRNQGQVTAAASTLSFYLSADGIISSTDIKIADVSVTSIVAGGSQTVSFNATVPSTIATGSYVIGAIADRGGVVAETDETNNTRAGGSIDIR